MMLKTMVTVGDREVSVRELTAMEIRDLMKKAEINSQKSSKKSTFDVGDILFSDVSFSDIESMTDATSSEIQNMCPSEIRAIADACKEVNEHFFGMIQRLQTALDEQMKKLAEREVNQSNA